MDSFYDSILWSLPTKMCQSRLSLQILHWLHEKSLILWFSPECATHNVEDSIKFKKKRNNSFYFQFNKIELTKYFKLMSSAFIVLNKNYSIKVHESISKGNKVQPVAYNFFEC